VTLGPNAVGKANPLGERDLAFQATPAPSDFLQKAIARCPVGRCSQIRPIVTHANLRQRRPIATINPSMTGTETSERFVLLETKIAYQEKLLSELSDLLREKGRELDMLTTRVLRLESARAAEGDGERLPYERPPHY